MFLENMQSVGLKFETFNNKCFFETRTFTTENFSKSPFPDDFVLMSETLQLFVQNGIFFCERMDLAENLNDVKRWSRVTNFDVDLMLILMMNWSVILSLVWFHENKPILFEFFPNWGQKKRRNDLIGQNLIDWEGIDGNVAKKLSVRSEKVPLSYVNRYMDWLRLNGVYFLLKLKVQLLHRCLNFWFLFHFIWIRAIFLV